MKGNDSPPRTIILLHDAVKISLTSIEFRPQKERSPICDADIKLTVIYTLGLFSPPYATIKDQNCRLP